LGVRYRKNYGKVTGTPDIAITKCKIAIFVDGDFWHAKDFEELKRRIQTNRSYWLKKFKRNRERDMEVNEALTEDGWIVLRYWESDIKKDLDKCVEDILEYVPVKRLGEEKMRR
ncbi:MAG: very short patch repair endonuclease, partial [Clostridia bacterium]